MVDERKHKHLEFIQGVINRLSTNSFFLKGWSVTLISVLLILSARYDQVELILLAFVPAFMFWFLDGYFLRQERLYRKLYDQVRQQEDEDIDFSMDAKQRKDKDKSSYMHTLCSITIAPFYVTLIVLALLALVLIACISKTTGG